MSLALHQSSGINHSLELSAVCVQMSDQLSAKECQQADVQGVTEAEERALSAGGSGEASWRDPWRD